MINIVVPMAGRGSRFAGTEDETPKPLIQVVPGKRMIEYVIDYLTLREPHRFTFVCLAAHDRLGDFQAVLTGKTRDHRIVVVREITAGPAASALSAASFIDNDDELLVAYCDMFLTIDMAEFLRWNRRNNSDGGVITYPSMDPMSSYAEIDAGGLVKRTAEKVIISDTATAGLYYFRQGRDFVASARQMLARWHAGSAEVFVSTLYNELIRQGKTVLAYRIAAREKIEMGTPHDLRMTRSRLGGSLAPAVLAR
jgi:NDP-sugar pyrophosphorylase family protein